MINKPNREWLRTTSFIAIMIITSCTFSANNIVGKEQATISPTHQAIITKPLTPSLLPRTLGTELFLAPPPAGGSLDLLYAYTVSASTQDVFGYAIATNKSFPITQAANVEGNMTLYPEAWSPSGDDIIVVWNRSYGPGKNPCDLHPEVTAECKTVYLMNANSLSAKPLFTFAQIQFAYMGGTIYWSPHSNSLVYAGADGQTGQGYLAVYDLNTSASSYLVWAPDDTPVQFRPLGWSPDGKEIFYISGSDRIMDHSLPRYNQVIVYKVTLETLEVVEIFDPEATIGGVALSPTNPDQMVVQLTSSDWTEYARDFELTFIDLITGQRTVLGNQGLNNGFRFSPDGKSIAFTRGGKEPQELCFWSVDEQTTSCAQDDYFKSASTVGIGSWLPDSQSIVVYRTSNLYDPDKYLSDTILVRPDGSRAGTLASDCTYKSDNPACSLSRIVWNPNYRGP